MTGRTFALLLALLAGSTALADVQTALEPRLVEEMDTVRLTLRVTGRDSRSATPDLAPLEADFEVLGTQTSSQYRSVNGQVDAWTEHQITLRPKRAGELEVPALTVGSQRSQPIRLVVRPMDPGVKRDIEQMVFFVTELTTNPVYVQAETVLVRRLFYSNGVQVYSDLPGLPQLANAVVMQLGDTQSWTTVREGQRYGVIEQRFAIFPEESGTLTVPEISITSSVRLQSGGRTRRSGIRISTQPLELEVLPVPAEYPRDAPWLPASDVRLTETWSPDGTSIEVGEPLSRSVGVTVIGNTGSSIPPLGLQHPEDRFKSYPAAPALDDENRGPEIVGTRIEEYSLIPMTPGRVVLPEVQLTWWDTNDERVRVARLPGRRLNVTGQAPRSREPAAPEEAVDAPAAAAPADAVPERTRNGAVPTLVTILLVGVAVAAAARLAGMAGGRWRRRRRKPEQPAADGSWRRLQEASASDDPGAFRAALLAYLQAALGVRPGDAVRRLAADPVAGPLWAQYNAARYGPPAAEAAVDRVALAAAARRLVRPKRKRRSDPLPELYDRGRLFTTTS